MSLYYILVIYLVTLTYGYNRFTYDFLMQNNGTYNVYLYLNNKTEYLDDHFQYLGYLKSGVKNFDLDFLTFYKGPMDVYLYFQTSNTGEYLGKTNLGVYKSEIYNISNIQDSINDICKNKTKLTTSNENEEEEKGRYDKNFIDNCLKYHVSDNINPCPGNKDKVCLFWRAKRKCISAIKSSVLIKSLMKFCDNYNYKDHSDCNWYTKSSDIWLARDDLSL